MSKRDTRRAARHAKRYGHDATAWPQRTEPLQDYPQHAAQHGAPATPRKLRPQSRRR